MSEASGIWREMIDRLHARLDQIIAGIDWSAREPHARIVAELIHDDIENFSEQVARDGDRLFQKLDRLARQTSELPRPTSKVAKIK
jgi:hypothetical protein